MQLKLKKKERKSSQAAGENRKQCELGEFILAIVFKSLESLIVELSQ
jgi:hypothetical protein